MINNKLKVLFVSRRYYPDVIGGGEISAHYIAKSLIDNNVDVRVVTFVTDKTRKDEIIDKVKITRLPIKFIKLFSRFSNMEFMYYEMYSKTKKIVEEFKPDIIHSLNGESLPSVTFLSKKYNIPFVVTINGPLLLCFTGEGVDHLGKNCIGCRGIQRFNEVMLRWGRKGFLSKINAFFYWIYSYPHMALFDYCLKKSSALLPVSNWFKDQLLRLNFSKNNVFVVHNPIEIRKINNTDLKAKLGISQNKTVLMYVGRLSESKGVQNIMQAMVDLPETVLVIIGRGSYEFELRRLSNNLDIKDRVYFIGFLQNKNLGKYYSIADVIIMSGYFLEALGRTLLEACSYGVPVIGTNIGGTPDIIEHGKNGYLLYNKDIKELRACIKNIISNNDLAKKMGNYGILKMKKEFSSSCVSNKLIEIYKNILNKTK